MPPKRKASSNCQSKYFLEKNVDNVKSTKTKRVRCELNNEVNDCNADGLIENRKRKTRLSSARTASKKEKCVSDKAAKSASTPKRNLKDKNNNLPVKHLNDFTHDNDEEEDSDDGADWEEVEDAEVVDLENYQPSIPENLTITLKQPEKRKKAEDWIETCIRQRINRVRKEIQVNIHKTHLLLYIGRLKFLNSIVNDKLVKALVISMNEVAPKKRESLDCFIPKFFKWFAKCFDLQISNDIVIEDLTLKVIECFKQKLISSPIILVIMIVSFLRTFSFNVRICYMLNPISLKPSNLLMKQTSKLPLKAKNPSLNCKKENIENTSENHSYWVEIFDEKKDKWKCYDFVNEVYNDPQTIASRENRNISYIISVDNDENICDITPRYAPDWVSYSMKKRRIQDEWWQQTLNCFRSPSYSKYEDADIKEFDEIVSKVELPKRISDYKNHPLFVLQKDLLKFQAIYPSDAPPVGFFRQEPVYSRNCVHILRSRETWLREARTVKKNEVPYKIVTSKFKIDKTSAVTGKKEMLDLFGIWQTQPFEPPVASNGVVPRNAYGNVELFQSCMLPKGTVHLKLNGLLRIATKLNIDCVPAVVGFDNNKNGRGAHPVMDGFVVCSEFEDILVDAWKQEQELRKQKENEKRLKRIYDNWKTLVKGLIIRHNLKIKYG